MKIKNNFDKIVSGKLFLFKKNISKLKNLKRKNLYFEMSKWLSKWLSPGAAY